MRALRDVGRHLVLVIRAVLALAGGLGRRAGLLLEFEPVAVPGELLETVTLDMLRVGQADRADALRGQAFVDLVEVVADQLLLGVGGLALVRLARVLAGRVVQAVPA